MLTSVPFPSHPSLTFLRAEMAPTVDGAYLLTEVWASETTADAHYRSALYRNHVKALLDIQLRPEKFAATAVPASWFA